MTWKDEFTYNPESGRFIRISTNNEGSVSGSGYMGFKVGGISYSVHRLIWLYMTSSWPKYEIDHIDGDKLNNKWINLRDIPHDKNMENMSIHRKGQSIGIYYRPECINNPWSARYKDKYLGSFKTEQQAIKARRKECESRLTK